MSAGSGSLRSALEEVATAEGCSMGDLTVLAVQNDPYRVDTPAGHRHGAWLADNIEALGLVGRRIHIRGLHYALIGHQKPDGTPYTNTDADWTWLGAHAAKAARWLGYVPFEQIVDQRNAAPVIRTFSQTDPQPFVNVGIEVSVPDVDDLAPVVGLAGFAGAQPYRLVMFGEKASLDDVLSPIANHYRADLYLPTGEISDTLLHKMASDATEDGRPLAVFTFSDADPSGWQMAISIAQKLRAFSDLGTLGVDFEVQRVALTPDHVREYGLPSTPLKATERRADRWRQAMGIEQTEIDALASLRPDLLDRIARDAITPFYDDTLDQRVRDARRGWITDAQAVIDSAIDDAQLERIRSDAAYKLASLRDELDAINDAVQVDVDDFDLPEVPDIPEADVDVDGLPSPLVDSRWPFADQCRALINSKRYTNGSTP